MALFSSLLWVKSADYLCNYQRNWTPERWQAHRFLPVFHVTVLLKAFAQLKGNIRLWSARASGAMGLRMLIVAVGWQM